MDQKPILAILYDFDHTLSPKDMQEYGFIPELGIEASEFWAECGRETVRNQMDHILSYMYTMIRKARGKVLLTRDTLVAMGAGVKLYDGVDTWFERINAYARQSGLEPEHYILSSGLKEIIEGTQIAGEFKEIYAGSFVYDEDGVPVWPAMAVNYTSKTQFVFRINKGILDVTEDRQINAYMPKDRRRVPFTNMIYIGDGFTDVPCMRLVKSSGGHSIAVWSHDRETADRLLREGRVDFVCEADYTEGSRIECTVMTVIDEVAAHARTRALHVQAADEAKRDGEAILEL
ncbi:MAG: haloacid dehalogenase-like hydrolase [Clostridia bacterium]|nr:haloacid dehalogenase-like hydrolase [Clostridia bacterium]